MLYESPRSLLRIGYLGVGLNRGTQMRILFVLAVVFCQQTLAQDFVRSATIDAAQETVALNGPVDLAIGSGGVTFDEASNTLSWEVSYANLTSPITVAHIHGPATVGVAAGVIVDLLAGGSGDSPITGSIVVSDEIAGWIRDGDSYINLHTELNTAGEIRGQLLPLADFDRIVMLDAAQTVNVSTGANNALGAGGLSFAESNSTLAWEISYQDLTGPLTMAHIHGPAIVGETAGVLIDLLAQGNDDGELLSGAVQIDDPAVVSYLRDGFAYVNLHTMQNGAGEIRGQIEPVAAFDRIAVIDPNQALNAVVGADDALGAAALSFDPSTNELNWEINFFNTTGSLSVAHIHGPASPNSTGGVLIDLIANSTATSNSLIGSVTVDDPAVQAYLAGALTYINLHTLANPGGEIRGQVIPLSDQTFDAAISPDQVVGALNGDTSAANGSGLLGYSEADATLVWQIEFEGLTSPGTVAHIHGPAPAGTNAGVLVNLADGIEVVSPLLGDAVIEPIVYANLAAGLAYINIHTELNGGGEIRGQVQPIIFADGFESP